MLIATAGHIDHGKTALVRALTGVETDRLPEEKARGISIDLGFAHWHPEPGLTIGFIDVPGHEGYLRNMLAGVSAVDFALLVVAADDGVMPQTREHLAILDLLGVADGVVVISKCDRVEGDRIAALRDELAGLLSATTLKNAPMVAVSSHTGEGIAALSAMLIERAGGTVALPVHDRQFRMAIDRAFTVTGAGTVAAGTIVDGRVAVGDRLTLSPAGLPVRVRGLQSGGSAVDSAAEGQRCAINLAGLDLSSLHRGDWLCAEHMGKPTGMIEAEVRVLADCARPLRHNSQLRLHIGTASIGARVLVSGLREIAPGSRGMARLILDQPTGCVTGDRLVLREASGSRTLGGGRVIDAFPPLSRRKHASRATVMAAFALAEPALTLDALLAIENHETDLDHFADCFNIRIITARNLAERAGARLLQGTRLRAIPMQRANSTADAIITALSRFHLDNPELAGLTANSLRAKLGTPLSPDAFQCMVRNLLSRKAIEVTGALVRLTGHSPTFSPAESAQWQRVTLWLEERGVQPFSLGEVVAELQASEAAVSALLFRRIQTGDAQKISDKRYMMTDQVSALAAIAARLVEQFGGRGFSAAQFRDASGLGRNFVIELLEYFDRVGLTRRRGDLRLMHPDFAESFGELVQMLNSPR